MRKIRHFLIIVSIFVFCMGVSVFGAESDNQDNNVSVASYSDTETVSVYHKYNNQLILTGSVTVTVTYDEVSVGRIENLVCNNVVLYTDYSTTTFTFFENVSTSCRKIQFVNNGVVYSVYVEVDEFGEITVTYVPYN